jgi:cell fate regulator YaaT (PSP1 superfamily)
VAHAIGVRFPASPKTHYFAANDLAVEKGDPVVVQTGRGQELGKVTVRPFDRAGDRLPQALRRASSGDLAAGERRALEAEELKWFLKARSRALRLEGKIVRCEFTLDGQMLTVEYSSEKRMDVRQLMRDAAARTQARLDFQQIGPRDESARLGAIGPCGMETCCSLHLQDFAPVTVRMARDQQLPLNPQKISGPCGRLLCCLQYEHEQYREILSGMPKRGARVCGKEGSGCGCGKVSGHNPYKGTVQVKQDEGPVVEVSVELLDSRGKNASGVDASAAREAEGEET